MNTDFQRALEFTLQWEKGYVNHPNDPGGETNFGISKRRYPGLDIPNLTLEQVTTIYYNDYWTKFPCKTAPFPLNICLFDTFVIMSPGRVFGWYDLCKENNEWRKFLEFRSAYHIQRAQEEPTQRVFLKGWLNRVQDLKRYIDILNIDV